MNSVMDLFFVDDDAGTLKIKRRNLASVVFPDDEGPERPIRSVFVVDEGVVDVMVLTMSS